MRCGELRIDLGCGPEKAEGFIGVDLHDYSWMYPNGEFVICDLEKGILPFCSDSAIEIRAHSILEHITNLIPLMNDIWRVLRKGGTLHVIVPKAGSEASFKDPTHVRFFLPKTFDYFKKGVRQENYGMRPWFVEFLSESEKEKSGTLEVIMKPDK